MADVIYDLCKLTPADVTIDVVGSAIEGGRSLSGVTQSIDYSGGGFVAVTYGGIGLFTSAQAKEWNRLAAALNGSVRTVDVPLWTDLVAVTNAGGAIVGKPGGAANPQLADPASLGDTLIMLGSLGTISIEGGEWFSISHGALIGRRAYRVWKVGVLDGAGHLPVYFRPSLREDTAAGEIANFWRPECQMRLPAGETMAWQFRAPGGNSELSVNFVEAF